jgi:hypothetical protein
MDVDRNRSAGRWVLSGSQQFHLMKNINRWQAAPFYLIWRPSAAMNSPPLTADRNFVDRTLPGA